MADSAVLSAEGRKHIIEANARFPDTAGVSEPLRFTWLRDRLYRLEACPQLSKLVNYQDTVEADRDGSDQLVVQRVVEKSDWRAFRWSLTDQAMHSEPVAVLLHQVAQVGGYWQRDGASHTLTVCLPPGVDFDPRPLMESASTDPPRLKVAGAQVVQACLIGWGAAMILVGIGALAYRHGDAGGVDPVSFWSIAGLAGLVGTGVALVLTHRQPHRPTDHNP